MVYTISVGIVEIDKEMQDYDTLIKYSEFALNEAKKKERIVVISLHKININNSFEEEKFAFGLQMQLINFNNFDVYYQPIIDIHTRNLIFRSLMRFKMKKK